MFFSKALDSKVVDFLNIVYEQKSCSFSPVDLFLHAAAQWFNSFEESRTAGHKELLLDFFQTRAPRWWSALSMQSRQRWVCGPHNRETGDWRTSQSWRGWSRMQEKLILFISVFSGRTATDFGRGDVVKFTSNLFRLILKLSVNILHGNDWTAKWKWQVTARDNNFLEFVSRGRLSRLSACALKVKLYSDYLCRMAFSQIKMKSKHRACLT